MLSNADVDEMVFYTRREMRARAIPERAIDDAERRVRHLPRNVTREVFVEALQAEVTFACACYLVDRHPDLHRMLPGVH